MSALEEIKKLEEQKQQLLATAKKEALAKATAAVQELNELGFDYQLVQGNAPKPRRTRKAGVRDSVLAEIKKHPNGISRQDLMTALNANDDKSQQSVSNAVSALKKADQITAEQGHYTAQG